MSSPNEQLKLFPDSWYAWEMIPGYIGKRNVPYCSPIFITRIVPRKTGLNILAIDFINVFYAEGVQDFSLDMRILKHSENYLIAELQYGSGASDRAAIISHIEFAWIERCCPGLWYYRPPTSFGGEIASSASLYLSEVFGLGNTANR